MASYPGTKLLLHVVSNLFWNHHLNCDKSAFCFSNKCIFNVLVLVLNWSHKRAEVELFPGCGEDLCPCPESQLQRGAGLCLQSWAVSWTNHPWAQHSVSAEQTFLPDWINTAFILFKPSRIIAYVRGFRHRITAPKWLQISLKLEQFWTPWEPAPRRHQKQLSLLLRLACSSKKHFFQLIF